MLSKKEKFLKLAEQLNSLGDLSIKMDKKLSEMQKTAQEQVVRLDPAHVTNFVKFYLGNR